MILLPADAGFVPVGGAEDLRGERDGGSGIAGRRGERALPPL